MTDYGLGRVHIPDNRDLGFPMQAVVPDVPTRTFRYWWASAWWGNQGDSSRCVAFAWEHWVADGPVTRVWRKPSDDDLWAAYRWMQNNDEWPGAEPDYEGTSIRAGAKYHQAQGRVSEYRWGWDLQTVVTAVLDVGPVVVGTNWYRRMFEPDDDGVLRIDGGVAGGHGYVVNGANTRTGFLRIKNSWGRDWGRNGHAYIAFEDFERLLDEDGDACLAIEVNT